MHPQPDYASGKVVLVYHALPNGNVRDNHLLFAWPCAGDGSFRFLPFQLSMVGPWPTLVITGNGGLGFDPGEGALEMATTSKEGSRRANYPMIIH